MSPLVELFIIIGISFFFGGIFGFTLCAIWDPFVINDDEGLVALLIKENEELNKDKKDKTTRLIKEFKE